MSSADTARSGEETGYARAAGWFRTNGLTFHAIELWQSKVRIYGPTAVLTGESRTVTSRNGLEARAHFRLIAVYAREGESIRLVHVQSTALPD